MRRIEKKLWSDFYDKVLDGPKEFEERIADFACDPGDVLVLREWNPRTREYTGRSIEKKVIRVLKTKEVNSWSPDDRQKYAQVFSKENLGWYPQDQLERFGLQLLFYK